ncbi:hypothetical protein M408DRAFT_330221 [Serendipita vermifera MAFF 305830]|uniref:F-box domain-containing protein n=1 Tax=Serendipita vermifera MAFF 305830 TaxID=933852 RepID=A0A0C3B6J5_SERVB|nr:hypothetical protein M408DRAFT_330221 [Serendipita vermifera MAFF 305830]
MWTPENKYALPSGEDIPRAREAIKQLKAEIELASLRVAEAQRYLDGLVDDLREREAWLAPVRRIPFDILSLIFTTVSKMDWRTPMSLAGVCRTGEKEFSLLLEHGDLSILHKRDLFAIYRSS